MSTCWQCNTPICICSEPPTKRETAWRCRNTIYQCLVDLEKRLPVPIDPNAWDALMLIHERTDELVGLVKDGPL